MNKTVIKSHVKYFLYTIKTNTAKKKQLTKVVSRKIDDNQQNQ